jgi:hypothetical protein
MGFLWGNGFQAADLSLNRAKNLQLGALMDDGLRRACFKSYTHLFKLFLFTKKMKNNLIILLLFDEHCVFQI